MKHNNESRIDLIAVNLTGGRVAVAIRLFRADPSYLRVLLLTRRFLLVTRRLFHVWTKGRFGS